MLNIGIADLKAHLSRHLKTVKAGETITVLDRDTPVARIVPMDAASSGLVVRRAKGLRRLADIPLPPPSGMKRDIVELLMEDRNGGR